MRRQVVAVVAWYLLIVILGVLLVRLLGNSRLVYVTAPLALLAGAFVSPLTLLVLTYQRPQLSHPARIAISILAGLLMIVLGTALAAALGAG